MNVLRLALAVAAKDLRIEARGRHAAAAVLPFAATLLIAFGLSLGPGRALLRQTAPALLWLAVLFAAVLAVRQSYQHEAEDGAMEQLVLAPIDRAAIFLGKAGAVALQLLVLEVAVVALVAILFGLGLGRDPLVLAAALVLGTVGLSAVGTLFGAFTHSARARETVFPLLVLPLSIPVVVAGVGATTAGTVAGAAEAASWLSLLLAFDVVVVAIGMVVFEHLVED